MPSRLSSPSRLQRARGSLVGLSVGDAFGQTFFRGDAAAAVGSRQLSPSPWRWTDDTAMALGIVQMLQECGGIECDRLAEIFATNFSHEPWRGYGPGTAQLLEAVRHGADWRQQSEAAFGGSGSMGNGAAMRVAPLGAYFADDVAAVVDQARASAVVTHAHPEGVAGAVAVATAAAVAASGGTARDVLAEALRCTPDSETRDGIRRASELPAHTDAVGAARALGSGWEILATDTVPFCLWCVFRNLDDYESALWLTAAGLGDRDTTSAIVGGIVGAGVGEEAIPGHWLRACEPLPGIAP